MNDTKTAPTFKFGNPECRCSLLPVGARTNPVATGKRAARIDLNYGRCRS